MPLLEHFRQYLKRQRLLQGNERVVVAVSGGPDSLCLLHLLWRLRDELTVQLHVAHLDHGFRGAESAAEAQFVASFAQRLDLPATIERRDVMTLMKGQKANKQAAARAVRYGFLAEVAQRENADVVVVAHHADDQAETVLMHLLRGAGPGGLAGMRQITPWETWTADAVGALSREGARASLIRPLLALHRADIEDYCARHDLEPRRDPSNNELTYTRSRLRTELLPLLREYNSHVSTALTHTAAICADDYDYLQQQLDALWPTLVREEAGSISFDKAAWTSLHPALQRYALRRAVERLAPRKEASFEQIEALRVALNGGARQRPNLPGDIRLAIGAEGFSLVLPQAQTHSPLEEAPQISAPMTVTVPGSIAIAEGWQLAVANGEPVTWNNDRWHLILDADRLRQPLALRSRLPGDRFRPEGGAGSKRLQDFFVDTKLSRELRNRWPLLVSGNEIVWVVGLRADSRFRPDTTTRQHLWVWITHNV